MEKKILSSEIMEAEVFSGLKEMVMTLKSLALKAPNAVIKIASLTRALVDTMARFVITTGQALAEEVIGVVNKKKINLMNLRYPQK